MESKEIEKETTTETGRQPRLCKDCIFRRERYISDSDPIKFRSSGFAFCDKYPHGKPSDVLFECGGCGFYQSEKEDDE